MGLQSRTRRSDFHFHFLCIWELHALETGLFRASEWTVKYWSRSEWGRSDCYTVLRPLLLSRAGNGQQGALLWFGAESCPSLQPRESRPSLQPPGSCPSLQPRESCLSLCSPMRPARVCSPVSRTRVCSPTGGSSPASPSFVSRLCPNPRPLCRWCHPTEPPPGSPADTIVKKCLISSSNERFMTWTPFPRKPEGMRGLDAACSWVKGARAARPPGRACSGRPDQAAVAKRLAPQANRWGQSC